MCTIPVDVAQPAQNPERAGLTVEEGDGPRFAIFLKEAFSPLSCFWCRS